MHITLDPYIGLPGGDVVEVVKLGDTLTVNGQAFDFSVIPDGATLPAGAVACEYLSLHPIERIDGVLHLTLRYPIYPTEAHCVYGTTLLVDPANGPLELYPDDD